MDHRNDPADALMAAIRGRRSFKLSQLRRDPVDPKLIGRVLEAANWAPSHGQTEPWRLTVFTGDARRDLGEAFAEAYRLQAEEAGDFSATAQEAQRDRVWEAPVWISVGVSPALKPDGSPRMPLEEETIAVGCALHNLHLMATALGLGGKWTTGAVVRHPSVARWLGLEPPARLLGFFYLGYPAVEWPEGKRRPLAEKVRWPGHEELIPDP
ncbi:MAG TPA: nitroreductase [Armatimonadota bacterium]|jgi:nitroreductase